MTSISYSNFKNAVITLTTRDRKTVIDKMWVRFCNTELFDTLNDAYELAFPNGILNDKSKTYLWYTFGWLENGNLSMAKYDAAYAKLSAGLASECTVQSGNLLSAGLKPLYIVKAGSDAEKILKRANLYVEYYSV